MLVGCWVLAFLRQAFLWRRLDFVGGVVLRRAFDDGNEDRLGSILCRIERNKQIRTLKSVKSL